MWNSRKTFQQTGFNLLTMQQTGRDVKLLPEEQGPLPLITPLCEQAKSLMEGKFSPKLLPCSTHARCKRQTATCSEASLAGRRRPRACVRRYYSVCAAYTALHIHTCTEPHPTRADNNIINAEKMCAEN